MRRFLRIVLLGAALTTVIGCRGCICSNVIHAFTDEPPEQTVRQAVEKKLPTAREIASELCGIPADGLKDAVVKVVSQTLGTSTVHVEGTVIAGDAGGDGGLDVKKALVCAGVLAIVLVPLLDGDGKEIGWKLSSMEVSGIETEGVHFDESHHHHHHHH